MLARLRLSRVLVVVARIPVFAGALLLMVATVAISGAGVLLREGVRAWTGARTTDPRW